MSDVDWRYSGLLYFFFAVLNSSLSDKAYMVACLVLQSGLTSNKQLSGKVSLIGIQ